MRNATPDDPPRSPGPSRGIAKITNASATPDAGASSQCLGVSIDSRAAPRLAPAMPPRLNAAWNDDMIAAPRWRSTTVACAFIATSSRPLLVPTRKAAAISVGRPAASIGSGSNSAKPRPARRVTRPVPPRRGVRTPVRGMKTNAPAANASSARLSSASDSASAFFNVGIAAAHEPMPIPLAANTASVARRIRETSPRWSATGCLIPCPIGITLYNAMGRDHPLTGTERSRMTPLAFLR